VNVVGDSDEVDSAFLDPFDQMPVMRALVGPLVAELAVALEVGEIDEWGGLCKYFSI
jgi:hypothetical protein